VLGTIVPPKRHKTLPIRSIVWYANLPLAKHLLRVGWRSSRPAGTNLVGEKPPIVPLGLGKFWPSYTQIVLAFFVKSISLPLIKALQSGSLK
jgi:hypothetical protein